MHDLFVSVDDGDFAAVGVDEEGDGGVADYMAVWRCFDHAAFADELFQEFWKFRVHGCCAKLDFFRDDFFDEFV